MQKYYAEMLILIFFVSNVRNIFFIFFIII